MKKLLGFFLAVVLLVSPVLAAGGSTVVYITRTGECYHADGCRFLQKSKIETTLADAVARGYRACKVCRPPELDDGPAAAAGVSDASPSPSPTDAPTPSPTASPSPTSSPTSVPSAAGLADTASAKASDAEKTGASGLGGVAILAAAAYALTRRRAKKK